MDPQKMLDEGLIPFLKKDAQINITLGAGFIKQLAIVSSVLIEGKSEEDIKKVESIIENKGTLEPWMLAFQTIQALFQAVYQKAEKEGMIEYKPISQVIAPPGS